MLDLPRDMLRGYEFLVANFLSRRTGMGGNDGKVSVGMVFSD